MYSNTGIAFGFMLAATILTRAHALEKRAWGDQDPFRIRDIQSLELSPSGDQLIFVISGPDLERNANYSSIWSIPTRGGAARPLTSPEEHASSPRWSPDGKSIAFFDASGSEVGLWIMDADGAHRREVTTLEKSNAFLGPTGNELSWSPDSKTLAFAAAGPRHYTNVPSPLDPPNGNDVMIVDRLLYKTDYYYSDLRRTYVWVVSASGGKAKQVTFGDYDYHSIDWSPDGKWIVAVSNRTGEDDYNANNDLVRFSPDGSGFEQITHTPGPEYVPVWSPDSSSIAYLARTRDYRSKESDAEFPKVFVLGSDLRAKDLTGMLDMWCHDPVWGSDGNAVYFTAEHEGKIMLYSVNLQDQQPVSLIDLKGTVTGFALGHRGEVYYSFTDATHAPEIFRTVPGSGKYEKLTEINGPIDHELDTVEPEHFTFSSFDGLTVEGWLIRPHGFDPARRYPMIIDIHGGPHYQYGYNLVATAKLQRFAGAGYVVVFMNPRGSTDYGQKFSDLVVGDVMGGDYRDIVAGTDYVLQKYPFIDSEHMGLTGVSYGGHMCNWITTHMDRFKASVPVSGTSDLLSGYGINANFYWPESDIGVRGYKDIQQLWDVSPLKYVQNIHTPTLFIQGAWDNYAALNQGEEMFTAMKRLHQTAVMAIYPNEGHGVKRQPVHTHDYYERSVRWFDTYLKPTGPVAGAAH
jgi:dipeptidyl aminopeptidase/acylaminoacyl peptidase